MSEIPPLQLGSAGTDDPVQSHDQILQSNAGKIAKMHCFFERSCPIRLSTYQSTLRTQLVVICSKS
jgi:hypothetical protein